MSRMYTAKDRSKARFSLRNFRIPRFVIITICALPAALVVLFYLLRPLSGLMDWVAVNVSAPVREFLGMLCSIYPFSLMEVLCTAAVIWLVYYIIKTISSTSRRSGKLKIISKRALVVLVAALYVWSLFAWLWNSGYYAPGFAEKNGFSGEGVTTEDLTSVTRLFAEKANELAPLVTRNDRGRFNEDHRVIIGAYSDIFENISEEFPGLDGKVFRPKSMMYSWLMSRTGYTGIYFALTGESNVNINMPGFFMPVTVAHELAHQLGVFAEDEANFVAIIACVTSENTTYEYSGYLMGLIHLLGALETADNDAWREISGSLNNFVIRDWQYNHDFWQAQKTVDTGLRVVDSILTAATKTVNNAVDSAYDSYLRANNQELGLRSYGAYLNLLVEYYANVRV